MTAQSPLFPNIVPDPDESRWEITDECGHILAEVNRMGDRGLCEVRFTSEDGRTMFAVRTEPDGKFIEVRGGDTCHVGDGYYVLSLLIAPNVSNQLRISTVLFERDEP